MGKHRRVMLNTNVFCRPFDDQLDYKLKEEADSTLNILSQTTEGKVKIITSDVLYEEIGLINDRSKRESVYYLVEAVESERVQTSKAIIDIADGLHKFIHDYNDCLHIASAGAGKCDLIITCDGELLKRKNKIESFLLSKGLMVKVRHPSECE